VKLSLGLIKAPRHKYTWGSEVNSSAILDLDSRCRWAVRITSRLIYPWERTLDTHCIGGRMGSSANLGVTEKRWISYPFSKWNSVSSVVQTVVWSLCRLKFRS
jgi:hypothetical protein